MFGDGAGFGIRSGVDPFLRLQEAGRSQLTTFRERSARIFGWQFLEDVELQKYGSGKTQKGDRLRIIEAFCPLHDRAIVILSSVDVSNATDARFPECVLQAPFSKHAYVDVVSVRVCGERKSAQRR